MCFRFHKIEEGQSIWEDVSSKATRNTTMFSFGDNGCGISSGKKDTNFQISWIKRKENDTKREYNITERTFNISYFYIYSFSKSI